jgi:hypothetical protein
MLAFVARIVGRNRGTSCAVWMNAPLCNAANGPANFIHAFRSCVDSCNILYPGASRACECVIHVSVCAPSYF